jgi:hypothetical protein
MDIKQDNNSNPFEFFDNLIRENGLNELMQEFMPDQGDLDSGRVVFNVARLSKTYMEASPEEENTFYFEKDFLVLIIRKEESKLRKLIDQHLLSLSETKQIGYLKTVRSRLNVLTKNTEGNKFLSHCIDTFNRLNLYCIETSESIKEISGNDNHGLTVASKKPPITSFTKMNTM